MLRSPISGKQSPHILKKLQKLKNKVQEQMQIKEDVNNYHKYKIRFDITQPENLIGGTLQQHQLEALQWMISLYNVEANGILADDMGLGKTIQAISFMAYLKQQEGIQGKHLVICPKSVSQNWIREINKWFPSAHAVLMLGSEASREQCIKKFLKPKKFDILVTTYEAARLVIYRLSKIYWQSIIVDEAHKIKNYETQNFKSLSCLNAKFKLLMTGTPLNNNLRELWTLLFFIMPNIFNDNMLFSQIQEEVQIMEGTEQERLHLKIKVAKLFHKIINPYFKRRAKKDLELGLPPKIQKTLYVPLSKMQLQLYRNFLRFGSVYGEHGHLDNHYMNARKICLHPYLFPGICTQEIEQGQQQMDFDEHWIQNCGKLKILDQLLKKFFKDKHKVLVFSQFTMFLDVFEEYCLFRNFSYCRLDGNTSLDQREEYMHDFNNTNKYQIFMLSTRAGGLGINLTGADRVVIYDIDWNPQNDVQAMDRAYRIGQTKPVQVYKLITEHTIEERISEFQKYKLIWDELVIQKGTFMSRKDRDDPFKNITLNQIANLGKGQIFKLKIEETAKTLEEIQKIGIEKNKKLEDQIRAKLQKQDDISKVKIFDSDSEDQTIPQIEAKEQLFLIQNRNYLENEKREFSKFNRYLNLPPFKFYIQAQKIKQLMFKIHMEQKREDRNQKMLQIFRKQLNQAKQKGKFQNWSEQQFLRFVDAHQLYLKNEYSKIAQFIESKNQAEVKQYSQYFFQRAPNNNRLSQFLVKIQLGQTLIRARLRMDVSINLEETTEDHQKKQISSKQISSDENYTPEILQTKAQIEQEIKMLNKIRKLEEKQTKNQQSKQKRQEQKQKLIEERKKKREEIEKRKEQRQIARQKRIQQNKIKAQKRAQLLEQRKQKKELKEEKRKKRQEQMMARRIEKEQKEAKQKAKSEQNKILRPSQRQSTSSISGKHSKDKKESSSSVTTIVIDH